MSDRKRVDVDAFKGHTPGPWKHDYAPGADECFIWPEYAADDQWDVIIAELMLRNGRKDSTDEANAALIAAAPDLLAEVVRLQAVLEQVQEYFVWYAWDNMDEVDKGVYQMVEDALDGGRDE